MKNIILGLDLALRTSGYGIIDASDNQQPQIIDYGLIKNPTKYSLGECLETLHKAFEELIDKFQPTHIAIEDCFIDKNPKVTLKLGMTQGVAILKAQEHKIDYTIYPPKTIKKSVLGNGFASKKQLSFILKQIFNISFEGTMIDCSDALATALCHLNSSKLNLFY